MIAPAQIKTVLDKAATIARHSKEISRLKGETFNVFSILKMETAENSTHSAFIGELLNPEGSHLMGDTFLTLFLNAIEYNDKFITKSATVTLEKYIGQVDGAKDSGGRIDIYIEDENGTAISIENKIYADDVPKQIQRYCNYRKGKNAVYYLTLQGDEPSDESKGTLSSGEDFNLISYRETIIKWLKGCLKHAAEAPILRESIKQYIILISKLTGQLTDDKMNDEIKKLIFNNIESARIIHENYSEAITDLKEGFRKEIKKFIIEEHKDEFKISANKITSINANLFLSHKSPDICIGIETFNGQGHLRTLHIGFWINSNFDKVFLKEFLGKYKLDQPRASWFNLLPLDVDMNNPETLLALSKKESRKTIVNSVCNKVESYISNNMDMFTELENQQLS